MFNKIRFALVLQFQLYLGMYVLNYAFKRKKILYNNLKSIYSYNLKKSESKMVLIYAMKNMNLSSQGTQITSFYLKKSWMALCHLC